MPDNILFQKDRLTVSDAKLTVGNATLYYPNVSATSIYDGRPYLVAGIAGVAGLVPLGFMLFMGARILGPYFPIKAVAIMFVPLIGFAIFGFTYRVKCLFLTIDGSTVAILKSKDRSELEVAQRAIEEAKRAYGARGAKA